VANAEAIIIIKKIKKVVPAHHGGAWKVAYADFVTAMMAFFLLLWLLNATTNEQKRGISDYFAPVAVSASTGGAGGLLGGRSISSPGASISRTSVPSVSLKIEPSTDASVGDAEEEGGADTEAEKALKEQQEREAKLEKKQFDKVEQQIRETIQQTPDLKKLEKHLLIDHTPEGMRIQVIDQEGRPMFASGGATPLARTKRLLSMIASAINPLPNKIRISGHTDSEPFKRKDGYGNWELSSDRAQATRRTLVNSALAPERIESVAGRAAQDPLLPENTTSQRNRRVNILLLKKQPPIRLRPIVRTRLPGDKKPAGRSGASTQSPPPKDWTGPRLR
jgi:chemotaxis protein MotB